MGGGGSSDEVGLLHLAFGDYTAHADRRRGDHLDVDARASEGLEHCRRNARVRAHTRTDDAHPGDRRISINPSSPDLGDQTLGFGLLLDDQS